MARSEVILAKRYAKALFELALSGKKLEKVESDLISFVDLIKESDDLNRFVNSPAASRDDQVAALSSIAKKMKICDLAVNYIRVLAENKRLKLLSSSLEEYSALLLEHKNEILAEVITAIKLSSGQLANVESALGKAVGKKVKVKTLVDENILGGLIVKMGSKMLDASVLGKLNRLEIISKKVIAGI